MSNVKKENLITANIVAVDLMFTSPNDVTRKGYISLKISSGDEEIELRFDLMEVGAKFSPPCYMNWKYKEPVKDGFTQFYDLMLFMGAKQPKELEGISVNLLKKKDGVIITEKGANLEPRSKVRWWDSRYRNVFLATLNQAKRKE